MSLLAFPSERSGCRLYSDLYSSERWESLIEQFRTENFQLFNLTNQSLLSVTLQAGLSALKTHACYDEVLYPFVPFGKKLYFRQKTKTKGKKKKKKKKKKRKKEKKKKRKKENNKTKQNKTKQKKKNKKKKPKTKNQKPKRMTKGTSTAQFAKMTSESWPRSYQARTMPTRQLSAGSPGRS